MLLNVLKAENPYFSLMRLDFSTEIHSNTKFLARDSWVDSP